MIPVEIPVIGDATCKSMEEQAKATREEHAVTIPVNHENGECDSRIIPADGGADVGYPTSADK